MSGKTIYLWTVLIFLCFGCNLADGEKNQAVKDSVDSKLLKPIVKQPVNMDTAALKKMYAGQAELKFGKPLAKEDFDLSVPLTEFRIEIYNYVKESERNDGRLKIRELTWNYNHTDKLTAWYRLENKKWRFLHYNIWPKDAVF